MTNSNVLDNSYNYYTHTILMKVILISMIISKFLSNKWVITLLADRKSTAHIHTHYAQMHTRELKIINNLAFLDPKKREEFNVSAIRPFQNESILFFCRFLFAFRLNKGETIYPIPCFPLNIEHYHKKIKFGIGAVPERSQSPSQLSHFMNKIINLGESQHIVKSVQLPRNEPIVGGGKQ